MPYRKFSLKETAEYLHIAPADLEQLVHHGEIPCERQGERVMFRKKELDAWASQRILGLPQKRLEIYHKRSSAAHDLSNTNAIIAELVRRESLEPALSSRTKPSALRDIVKLAAQTGLVADPAELLASLEEREEMCSTALPGGLALLHPRHHEPYMFDDSFIIVAKTVQPIQFSAPDGSPTDLFFLICCQDDKIHLHALARLCVMCIRTKLLTDLRAATDRTEMYESIAAAEVEAIKQL
jgi:nitrogen PTS system EIIA component